MSSEQGNEEVEIVVLGRESVGKTCLIEQFVNRSFVDTYEPTTLLSYTRDFSLEDRTVALTVFEAGEVDDDYFTLLYRHIKTCSAVLLVYSVTDRQSFDELDAWVSLLERLKDADASQLKMVLCGNKSDFSTERQVSMDEGLAAARSLCCPFIETSAKTADNVEEAFYAVTRRSFYPSNENAEDKHNERNCIIC